MQLEEPTERLRIVMAKWGKTTEDTVVELSFFAPGWSAYLQMFVDLIDPILGVQQ